MPLTKIASDLLSSGIAGLVQLGAAGINYASQQSANRQNIQLAQQQNMYNLNQWRRETDYNSPLAQIARLKAAGINPGLAYANGSMMNEGAASPQMISGRVQAPYLNPVDLSQIRLNEALAGKADKEGDLAASGIGVNAAKIKDLEASARNLDAKTEGLGYENQLASATLAQRIAAAASKAEADDAKAKLSKKESNEAMQYVDKTLKAQWDQLEASAEEAKNRKLISDQQLEEAKELVNQARAKTSMLEYQDTMKEWTYWINVADKALSHVEDIIALFLRLNIPIQPPKAPSDRTVHVPGAGDDEDDVPDVFN